MKNFKTFIEQVSPKDPEFNKLPVTIDDAITGRIRDLTTIKKSSDKFRKRTGFNLPLPLAKRKYSGKINSDVLKSNPQLNPDKPGDYIKLKKLSAKVKKA